MINVSANFSDPGTADTHTAEWDWDDGSISEGTVSEADGSGSVTGNHTYAEAGVYTVKLTVIDDDGDSGASIFQFVVVYDPEGGFVTGGGWIDSPAGAYVTDPSLVGKATFGFVSKYKKGADVPTGQTEFQFKAGNLNFHSDIYDWLVVAGPHAKFKGTGTINGGGNYGFMVTATDSNITGGGDSDGFRIKIWDKDNGDIVVYDNKMGASDDSNETTDIGGGSIVIHKAK
jgi:PKD repeat protein